MAHTLISAYGFLPQLSIYQPTRPAEAVEMARFHEDAYLEYLQAAATPLETTLFGNLGNGTVDPFAPSLLNMDGFSWQRGGGSGGGGGGTPRGKKSGGVAAAAEAAVAAEAAEAAPAAAASPSSSSAAAATAAAEEEQQQQQQQQEQQEQQEEEEEEEEEDEEAKAAAARAVADLAWAKRYNTGSAPGQVAPFGGLWEYCQIYTSGSLAGAERINRGLAEVVVHWGGGHALAKPSMASGSCFVNDTVLSILELLQGGHSRVLYVDVGVFHGQAVEEAFYATDRVMTLSFHKEGDAPGCPLGSGGGGSDEEGGEWGAGSGGGGHGGGGQHGAGSQRFFPGTGRVEDCGTDAGRGFALNMPLPEGTCDDDLQAVFRPLLREVMSVFQPSAIVVGGGTSGVYGDRLGCWNLSAAGHGDCVAYLKAFGVPLLLLGGPGTSLRTTGRVWARTTAVALGLAGDLAEELPDDRLLFGQRGWYAPDYQLQFPVSSMQCLQTRR